MHVNFYRAHTRYAGQAHRPNGVRWESRRPAGSALGCQGWSADLLRILERHLLAERDKQQPHRHPAGRWRVRWTTDDVRDDSRQSFVVEMCCSNSMLRERANRPGGRRNKTFTQRSTVNDAINLGPGMWINRPYQRAGRTCMCCLYNHPVGTVAAPIHAKLVFRYSWPGESSASGGKPWSD